jgi:16S rRNA (uracil1498-N3)-methyltransferase
MKIHRFIVDADFAAPIFEIPDREVTHQIRSVLKLKVGETIILGNGRLDEVQCRITAVGLQAVEVEVISRGRNRNEFRTQVVLFCAILKKDHFELVVQKATEVGVTEIYPVISKRTVKLEVNMERLTKVAKEASEQSGRGIVPTIHDPVKFSEALLYAAPNDANYFFEQGAPSFDRGVLSLRDMNRVGVFIGTEGGWDETEVAAAKQNLFHVASLGTLTLRAETAAIIATYLINGPQK